MIERSTIRRDKRHAVRSIFLMLGVMTLCHALSGLSQAAAQGAPAAQSQNGAPAQQPPAQTYAPPAQGYPPAPPPAYPQQAYPQQAYPQQAYPQQAYPQAYPQQPYQPAYPQQPYQPAPRKPRLSRGLLVAGIITLSVSYGVSAIVGSSLIDTRCCDEVGAYMLVPVVGPYLAASQADNAKGVLTLLGTVEVVGTALLIGGIIRYKRSKREAEADGYYSWSLPRGRTLSLDMATGPRLVGPSMRLKF